MSNRLLRSVSILLCLFFFSAPVPGTEGPKWYTSSDEAFALAQREHRFVILDLEAVWCHWCHVMEHETYANADVRKVLAASYVALKIDQDANPDISARYGDWGWPATIVFASDGSEIVKRRGYIEPQAMLAMLKAIVADPSPGPSVGETAAVAPATSAILGDAQRKKFMADFVSVYNARIGGWGDGQHYIDAPSMELALELAHDGDAKARGMAQQTLDQNLNLIDPVWGGVYQYSVGADWKSPHFEKIMSFQADDLRLYALAYALWHEQKYLDAAHAIQNYIASFLLSPDGAFHVSQDADLSTEVDGHKYYALDNDARRKLGIPRIDKHLYTRENAWAITALCQSHDSLGDAQALGIAERAAQWVLAHRALADGGFRHDEKDASGPYLADNVAMAQALLSLYRSSGGRDWLKRAEATLAFIDTHFRANDAGYFTAPAAKGATGVLAVPMRIVDENIALARTANLAYRTTANERYKRLSEYAMRFAAAPAVAESRPFLPGLILADRELSTEPVHIAIVGRKDDPAAQLLQAAALSYPEAYMRVDWWDRREGPLPNPDVTYPTLAKAAAFGCTGNACSLPVFDAQKIAPAVDRLRATATAAQ
ncbi:MAG: DUF255 domain-containing protein [Rudaea sp.]|nr:DUF255 domain-containing protein [Rudaea sp.]